MNSVHSIFNVNLMIVNYYIQEYLQEFVYHIYKENVLMEINVC